MKQWLFYASIVFLCVNCRMENTNYHYKTILLSARDLKIIGEISNRKIEPLAVYVGQRHIIIRGFREIAKIDIQTRSILERRPITSTPFIIDLQTKQILSPSLLKRLLREHCNEMWRVISQTDKELKINGSGRVVWFIHEGMLYLFRIHDRRCLIIRSIPELKGELLDLSVSNTMEYILLREQPGNLYLFRKNGKLLWHRRVTLGFINQAMFSKESDYIISLRDFSVSFYNEEDSMKIIDRKSGVILRGLTFPIKGSKIKKELSKRMKGVPIISCVNEGRYGILCILLDGRLFKYNVRSGKIMKLLKVSNYYFNSLDMNRKEDMIAIGAFKNTMPLEIQ